MVLWGFEDYGVLKNWGLWCFEDERIMVFEDLSILMFGNFEDLR
mgnify:FL=1